ncbi:unnamed protein product [Vitrella brassicaformis CCMP3155]|uniref:Uncharacterized protein n=1 Tax=Vitrella brassicaformis (strain CCMP3155) TaxID=1169540 RepID=A0A0G4G3T6_VITBC|nr:unnamed protein product [Vitrella brassicaformis CCMP3155]|eukprot:CEM23056.1 unnamed protein product [Vitrella brassicaformis CCMP3155]
MQFQHAASNESRRLQALKDRSHEHLTRPHDESFKRDVERRIAARDREAAEQLRQYEEATETRVREIQSDMQAQLEEERAKREEELRAKAKSTLFRANEEGVHQQEAVVSNLPKAWTFGPRLGTGVALR